MSIKIHSSWTGRLAGKLLGRYPLLLAALAAGAGIEIASRVAITQGFWLVAAGIFLLLWWALRFRWHPRWPFALLLTLVFFSWRHQERQAFIQQFPWRAALEQGGERIMEARGEVMEVFHPGRDALMPARLAVELHELADAQSGKTFHGRWRVLLLAVPPAPLPGHLVRWRARFFLPPPPDNPGQFAWPAWLKAQGLSLIAELPRGAKLSNEGPAPGWLPALRRWCAQRRAACEAALTAGITLPGTAGVIKAMVLGVTEDTSPEIKADFQRSGTLHLFSVSGMHVAMVGTVLWFILRIIGVPKRRSPWILLPALFLYTAITGASVPAIRAALMMGVVLAGLLIGRRGALLNSLGAAALVLLAWRPEQWHNIGFQLSFAAVAGIALFTPFFQQPFRRWVEPDPFLPRLLTGKWQRRIGWVKRWLASALAVSAAAMTATAPLILVYFHLFSPIAILANLPAAALAFLMMSLALASLGLSIFLGTAGGLLSGLNQINSGAAWALLKCTHFFAGVPGGSMYVDHRVSAWISPPLAEVCVLRLPQGGAAVWLRTPDGHWLLDCGGRGDHRSRVLPALHALGVNRLHGVILSHADARHAGGIALLEAQFKLKGRYLKAGDMVALADPVQKATSNRLLCLHPSGQGKASASDDAAGVWRLELGKWRVLLSTDAGFATETELLRTLPEAALRADVWIKNQHAADLSGTENFTCAVGARHVIVSSDAQAEHEQMPPDFPGFVQAAGGECWDQSLSGAVFIRFYPDFMEVEAVRKLEK